MNSLIDNILSLEGEANSVLDRARAQAKEIEKDAEVQVAAIQEEVRTAAEQRIAQYRAEAEKKHQADLVQARAGHERALKSIEQISESAVAAQVQRVVARFREL